LLLFTHAFQDALALEAEDTSKASGFDIMEILTNRPSSHAQILRHAHTHTHHPTFFVVTFVLLTSDYQIMYEHLFESDAAGDQCKFAEAVREQSLFEYNELIADLQTAMVGDALCTTPSSRCTARRADTCPLASRFWLPKTVAAVRFCPKKR